MRFHVFAGHSFEIASLHRGFRSQDAALLCLASFADGCSKEADPDAWGMVKDIRLRRVIARWYAAGDLAPEET